MTGFAPRSRPTSSRDVQRWLNVPHPQTPVFSLLRCFGLQQYAKKVCELGFADLDTISRLTDGEMLELVENVQAYPGHQLKLVRCLDCFRVGAQSQWDARDAHVDAECLEMANRLAKENQELLFANKNQADCVDDFQRERARHIDMIRKQDAAIQDAQAHIKELEVLLEDRTKQTCFLTEQLQSLMKRAEEERTRAVAAEDRARDAEERVAVLDAKAQSADRPVSAPGGRADA